MSVNKAILIGHVGQDPQIKDVSGVKVANFSLATTERGYKTANGTEIPERTEWHNVVCWRSLADIIEKYVHKGSHLYVEGKIKTRSYEQDGVKKYATDIHVDNIQLLGKKEGENQNSQPTTTHPSVDSNYKDDLPF